MNATSLDSAVSKRATLLITTSAAFLPLFGISSVNDQLICFGFCSFGDWRLFGIWDFKAFLLPATTG